MSKLVAKQEKRYIAKFFATNLSTFTFEANSKTAIMVKLLDISHNYSGYYPCCEDVEVAIYTQNNEDYPIELWHDTGTKVHIEKL
jgi:hypothetical protein